MKKIHIALAVRDYAASLRDYSARLRAEPCCTVDGTYALWRTEHVNLSISVNPDQAGTLRHLGFEDSSANEMSEERDTNGVVWECFGAEHQRDEIRKRWPNAHFNETEGD